MMQCVKEWNDMITLGVRENVAYQVLCARVWGVGDFHCTLLKTHE